MVLFAIGLGVGAAGIILGPLLIRLGVEALDLARAEGLTVRPDCSYVAAWMRRHPESLDLLAV